MVIANQVTKQDGGFITEYRGLRSDAMPITASVGDIFIYEDQGDTIFKFTENGWVRIVEGEGGEGKASAVVHLTATETGIDADMSIAEIANLIKNDVDVKLIVCYPDDMQTYNFSRLVLVDGNIGVTFARSGIGGQGAYLGFVEGYVINGVDRWGGSDVRIPATE